MEGFICRCFDAAEQLLCAPMPVSFRLKRNEDAPADSLELVLDGNGLPAVCRVELWAGAVLWFAGLVDEQNETADANGRSTELVCRSFEALLLDNQAAAGTVRNPSRAVLEHWQLRPLGIACAGGSGQVFGGEYTVAFGADVYTAAERFAELYFGSGALWMEDRHTLRFGPREERHHVLPTVAEVEYCRRPVERISEVAMQSSESGVYDVVMENTAAKQAGVLRRRFLRAGDTRGAEKLAAGEAAAFSLHLAVPGAVNVRPGDRIDAVLQPFGYKDLQAVRVTAVQCTGNANGTVTRLDVQAEEHNVE